MKSVQKLLLTSLLSVTTMAMVSCGNADTAEKPTTEPEAEVETLDRTSVKGHVIYASPDWLAESTQQVANEFMKEYPNVTVEIAPFSGDVNNYLTAQAAVGEMPDVVEGYQSMSFALSQGWLSPLNEYVKDDEEFKYVPKELLDSFIIDGNLYAIPNKLTLSGVIVNLDLLEQLNLDVPDYNWTVDTFLDYAKKATNNKNSGISSWGEYEREFMGMFYQDGAEYGYNSKTQKFEFTNDAFKKAFNYKKDLFSVPGLVADTLYNQELRDADKEDDYQKKFGKEGNGFDDGKILFRVAGMWTLDSFNANFNYDYYPLPHDPSVGYKEAVHIDQIYLTSAVKDENKQASFEFLKWMTYGVDGVKSRFKLREGVENPAPRYLLPGTTHPEVAKLVTESDDTLGGVKYIYENLDKAYRVDLYKIVPGMWDIISGTLWPTFDEINKGNVEAASVAAELEEKANTQLEEYRTQFKSDMSKFDQYKVTVPLDKK